MINQWELRHWDNGTGDSLLFGARVEKALVSKRIDLTPRPQSNSGFGSLSKSIHGWIGAETPLRSSTEMKIFVKTLKGSHFEIEAKREDTVRSLSHLGFFTSQFTSTRVFLLVFGEDFWLYLLLDLPCYALRILAILMLWMNWECINVGIELCCWLDLNLVVEAIVFVLKSRRSLLLIQETSVIYWIILDINHAVVDSCF